MKIFLSLLLVILSIVGIADASYLTYEEFAGVVPPCTAGFQCETVLTSPYAHIGPIPLSAVGIFYYIVVFVLSVLHFVEADFTQISIFKNTFMRKSSPIDLLQLVTIGGLLFTVYLVFLMGVVIQAWCLYCLISAATSTLLFTIVQVYSSKYTERSGFITKTIFHTVIAFLYQKVLKPIFFFFDPEIIHDLLTNIGKLLGSFKITQLVNQGVFNYSDPVLSKTLDGITFPNPVGLSAGFDYNADLTQILPSVGFGWHTVGTVTYEPSEGNSKPMLSRFPNSKALLVNKGLKNIGSSLIIKKLSNLQFAIPVGISIGCTNKKFSNINAQITDIIACFKAFENSQVSHSYYELNISCPNAFGGESFTSAELLEKLLKAVDALKIKKPIYVKMPIDQSEKATLQLLKVIHTHTIAGIIVGNLTKDKTNPAVKPEDAAAWQKRKGNLSGKPTFERSNALISLTKKHYKNRFTIIGTGGIFSPEDAAHKLQLGADLVQLITGMIFQGPQLIGSINRQLATKNL